MTNLEFSEGFDLLYNNIRSEQAPGLDEWEKSFFLTKALDEIIKDYFNPIGNKYGQGFDGSERRLIDFSKITEVYNTSELYLTSSIDNRNLLKVIFNSEIYNSFTFKIKNIVSNSITGNPIVIIPEESNNKIIVVSIYKSFNTMEGSPSRETTLGDIIDGINLLPEINNHLMIELVEGEPLSQTLNNSLLCPKTIYMGKFSAPIFDTHLNTLNISLPSNIMMIINEITEVMRDNKHVYLLTIPIQYTEYTRLMSKPYKRPLKNQAWRILNSSTTVSNDLIVGPNDTIINYILRYIRKPRPIRLDNFEGEITLDDGYSLESSCELDPILHQEILQRAVELAKLAWDSQSASAYSLIAAAKLSGTELGNISRQ